MQSGVAASFRRGLELVSGGTLVAVGRATKPTSPSHSATQTLMGRPSCLQALSVSTLTQVNVWREVRTTGEDHEHDDYKASTRTASPCQSSIVAELAMLRRCAWRRSTSRRWRSNWSTAAKWLVRASALLLPRRAGRSSDPLWACAAKLKEAHALLEAERLEAIGTKQAPAVSATFANPLDEDDAGGGDEDAAAGDNDARSGDNST